MTKPELVDLAKRTAVTFGLDPVLVCAVVEQESAWNTNAIRLEQGFYLRYVRPQELDSAVEAACRAVSFGLMQVMGQVAREHGYTGDFSALCEDPEIGIQVGCTVLKKKLARAKGDLRQALLYWNGGSNQNYPAEVAKRMEKYR